MKVRRDSSRVWRLGIVVVLALAVVAVLMAACGDDDSSATQAPTLRPTPTIDAACSQAKLKVILVPTVENQLARMRGCLQVDLTGLNIGFDGNGQLDLSHLDQNHIESVCKKVVEASGYAAELYNSVTKSDLGWLAPLAQVVTAFACPGYFGYLTDITHSILQ